MKTMWPMLADISFKDVHRLETPILLFLGRHDYTVPAPIAERWAAQLSAPSKRVVWFEHSAHLPMIEEPGRTLKALLDYALPLATR